MQLWPLSQRMESITKTDLKFYTPRYKMYFERLLQVHVNCLKKLIRGKINRSENIVHHEKKCLNTNTIELTQSIAELFNAEIMGQRFRKIWEDYLENIYVYIDSVFTVDNVCKDFGDDKAYRDSFLAISKLRKNSGEIVGFFIRYLNNRHRFKPIWIFYMQALKDSIDDGLKMFHNRGSTLQFRKSTKECKERAKEFGRLVNTFR